jgi:hypothetical protein
MGLTDIQSKRKLKKVISPQKYLNVLLRIFKLCNLKCCLLLSFEISQLINDGKSTDWAVSKPLSAVS